MTSDLSDCIEEIRRADFVALDLEFSGLFVNNKKSATIEDYYTHCSQSVEKFMAVQLGVCCARRLDPLERHDDRPKHDPGRDEAPGPGGGEESAIAPGMGGDDDRLGRSAKRRRGRRKRSNSGSAGESPKENVEKVESPRSEPDDKGAADVIDSSDGGGSKFILCPYNFHLYPRDRRTVFGCDSLCLSWLQDQGFDLNRWVRDGLDYERLQNVTCVYKHVADSVKLNGAQRIIETIIEHGKPVVLHNGLLDLLHVYDKFIAPLPDSLTEFGKEIVRLFPGGIYDTKRIAAEGRDFVFPRIGSDRGATSLDSLRLLLHTSRSRVKCILDPHSLYILNDPTNPDGTNNLAGQDSVAKPGSEAAASSPSKRKHPGNSEQRMMKKPRLITAKEHEAGYDSLITMHLFLLELEAVHLQDKHSSFAIPEDWSSMTLMKSVRDKLEVVGIAPGFVDLIAHRSKIRSRMQTNVERPAVTGEEILSAPLFKNVKKDL